MRYVPRVVATVAAVVAIEAQGEPLALERDELKFGFIKLTDMAPLAVAYELGYFEDEGLYVTLEPQANWKVLLDRVITGELDGAHMLAGQPLGATIGFGTNARVVTAFSMDLNGNAITVSNEVWRAMKPHVPAGADGKPLHPVKADALKPVVESYRAAGRPFNMAMVFPVSTHNYELRYWLASSGIDPDRDIRLVVVPPPRMGERLKAGDIDGFCVTAPWNALAVSQGDWNVLVISPISLSFLVLTVLVLVLPLLWGIVQRFRQPEASA